MMKLTKFKLEDGARIKIGREEDAGIDIFALPNTKDGTFTLKANTTHSFSTGIRSIIPDGYYAKVEDRSSMFKQGLKTSGVIDSGYRGDWAIMIANLNPYDVTIDIKNNAIAQAIIIPFYKDAIIISEEEFNSAEKSERGENGFGSTNE